MKTRKIWFHSSGSPALGKRQAGDMWRAQCVQVIRRNVCVEAWWRSGVRQGKKGISGGENSRHYQHRKKESQNGCHNRVCAGQRWGRAAGSPLLQGLLRPGEFRLHLQGQKVLRSGGEGEVSRKGKSDYLTRSQIPFQLTFKPWHYVPIKSEEGKLFIETIQNVKALGGDSSQFSSHHPLTLENQFPQEWKARQDFSRAGPHSGMHKKTSLGL